MLRALVLALVLASPGLALAQSCPAPERSEARSTEELALGARGWLEVRWDAAARAWAPVRALEMPLHHASRVEIEPTPELDALRARMVRIHFVVRARELVPSRRRGVSVDATYRLGVESLCVP